MSKVFRPGILYLLLTLVSPALAQAEPDVSLTEKPALFLLAEVWPWGYFDENREPTGLLSQLVEQLASTAELPLASRVVPHQRLLHEFRRGEADFTVVFENPSLEEFATSLGSVLETNMLLISMEGSDQELSLKGLSGRTIGYIRGTYYGEDFEHDDSVIKVPLHNMEQALDMLMMGRVDTIISSDVVLSHSLSALKLKVDAFRYRVHAPGYPANLYMAHQSLHPEYGPLIKAALDKMRASGELDEIFALPRH